MDERQRAILDGLTRLFGAGAGSFCQDAVRFASDATFLARSNYVGLSMREIQSSMFAAFGMLPDTIGAFDRGRQRAKDADLDNGPEEAQQEVSGEGPTRRENIRQIAKLLNVPESDERIQWWLNSRFDRLTHRSALNAPRQLAPEDWARFEDLLELLVERYEATFKVAVVDRRLAELLRVGPTHPDAAKILDRLPQSHRPIAQSYCCRHAGPEWITHLPAKWLENPPPLEPVPGRPGSFWHPAWPVAAFFARAAPSRPDEVHGQIMGIMGVGTPNHWVHRDMALAELHVPGPKMAAWASLETQWLGEQAWVGFPLRSPLADCVRSLVAKNEPDAAFELARVLFSFDAPLSADLEGTPDQVDAYDFINGIRQVAHGLAPVRPVETVEWLGELVAKQFASTDRRMASSLVPDLAENDTALFKVVDLVRVLRDVSDTVLAERPDAAGEVVETLRRQPDESRIVERVRLHLLGRHIELVRAEAIAALTEPATFAPGLVPEVYALLRSVVPTLAPDERSTVMDAIVGGTLADASKDRLRNLVMSGSVGVPVDEEIEELAPRITVHDIVQDAPVPQTTLAAWPVAELVSYLTTWEPQDDREAFFGGAALQGIVSNAIAENPEKYAADALAFQDLQPEYVSTLFNSLIQSVTKKHRFPWVPVVELAAAVLNDALRRKAPVYADVRRSIAQLFLLGLSTKEVAPGLELAARIWPLLAVLAEDPSPSRQEEAQALMRGSDIASIAYNWTRPQAVEAIIRYAIWIRGEDPKPAPLPPGVRRVLRRRLGFTTERSLAVRAIFGLHLGHLFALDPAWIGSELPRLFPADRRREAQWGVVLDFYLGRYLGPNATFLGLLRPQYERALATLDPQATQLDARAAGLAHHLATMYWWGLISLEPLDPLIAAFYAHASPVVAKEPLDWIGWNLWRSSRPQHEKPLAHAVADRLMRFWEWRVAESGDAGELAPFGWWFASGLLDPEWSLQELQRALDAGVRLGGSEHPAMGRARELAPMYPLPVIKIAKVVFASAPVEEPLGIAADDLYAIARIVQEPTTPPEAQTLGAALESQLISRGYDPSLRSGGTALP